MNTWLKGAFVAGLSLFLAGCGQGATESSSTNLPGQSRSPLQAFIECDDVRSSDALSGMRLAGEYANGRFYIPTEPIEAFGVPVAGVLAYKSVHYLGQAQPPTSPRPNTPAELYSVPFLRAPGNAAKPAFVAWAAARGEGASDPVINIESGEVDELVWPHASAIQSVSAGALPRDVEEIIRGLGGGAFQTLSRVFAGGETEDSIARSINLEATESGSMSAVHCPGYMIWGGF